MKNDVNFKAVPSQVGVSKMNSFGVGTYVPQYQYALGAGAFSPCSGEAFQQAVQKLQEEASVSAQTQSGQAPLPDGPAACKIDHAQQGKRRPGSGERHRFLRMSEVCRKVGLARSTIYKLLSVGAFPTQIAIGPRAVAFLEQEIDNWMAARVEAAA